MSVRNDNEVRVEKVIKAPAKVVFQALSEGRLFNNCGAAMDRMSLDFRAGGRYQLHFSHAEVTVCGRFAEILPDRKIRFTWGDEGSDSGFPLSEVLVELFPDGETTRIVIVHTGFQNKDQAEDHDQGWTAGLDDLDQELVEGRIHIIRSYPVDRESLYRSCSDIRKFLGLVSDTARGELDFRVGGSYRFPTEKGEILGEFMEIVPGRKIVFSWLSGCDARFERPTRVTLAFDDEDSGTSSLELTHEALPVESVKSHREGWEFLARELRSILE